MLLGVDYPCGCGWLEWYVFVWIGRGEVARPVLIAESLQTWVLAALRYISAEQDRASRGRT